MMAETTTAILEGLKELKAETSATAKAVADIQHRLDLIDNNTTKFNEDKWAPMIKSMEKIGDAVASTSEDVHKVRSEILTIRGQFVHVEHRLNTAEKKLEVLEKTSQDTGTKNEVLNTRVIMLVAILAWAGMNLFDRLFPKAAPPPAQAQPPVIYIVPQKSEGPAIGSVPAHP